MATDINTIQNIQRVFQAIAKQHKFINGFVWGQDSNIGASQEATYPLLVVKPSSAKLLKSEDQDRYATFEVNIQIKVVDQIMKDNEINIDVESDSLQTLREIIVAFNDSQFYQDSNLLLQEDVDFDPLDEFNDDLASGWQCNLTMKMRNPYNNCNLPLE